MIASATTDDVQTAAQHLIRHVREELRATLALLDETDLKDYNESGMKGAVVAILRALRRRPPEGFPAAAIPVADPRSELKVRAHDPAKGHTSQKKNRYMDVLVELPGDPHVHVIIELKWISATDIMFRNCDGYPLNQTFAKERTRIWRLPSTWSRTYVEHRALRSLGEKRSDAEMEDVARDLVRLNGYREVNGKKVLQHITVGDFVYSQTSHDQLVPYVDGWFEQHDAQHLVIGFTMTMLESFACYVDEYTRSPPAPSPIERTHEGLVEAIEAVERGEE